MTCTEKEKKRKVDSFDTQLLLLLPIISLINYELHK